MGVLPSFFPYIFSFLSSPCAHDQPFLQPACTQPSLSSLSSCLLIPGYPMQPSYLAPPRAQPDTLMSPHMATSTRPWQDQRQQQQTPSHQQQQGRLLQAPGDSLSLSLPATPTSFIPTTPVMPSPSPHLRGEFTRFSVLSLVTLSFGVLSLVSML